MACLVEPLPTNTLLKLCNIVNSDLCPICTNHAESSSLILRECVVSREVWLALSVHPYLLPNTTIKEWLQYNLEVTKYYQQHPVVFPLPFHMLGAMDPT